MKTFVLMYVFVFLVIYNKFAKSDERFYVNENAAIYDADNLITTSDFVELGILTSR
jgi:hypothetical protein